MTAEATARGLAASRIRPTDLVPWLLTATGPAGRLDRVPVDRIDATEDGSVVLEGHGARFRAEARWVPLSGRSRGWSVTLEVVLDRGGPGLDASVAVAVAIPADRDPAWLIPGLFYGSNRPSESRARYPRWVAGGTSRAAGDPFGAAAWAFRADRAATPSVFASGGGLRAAIATRGSSPVGLSGVGFATDEDGSLARRVLSLSFPYREEPVVYDGSETPLPADRPTVAWLPGEPVRLAFRVHVEPDDPDATTRMLRDVGDWLSSDSAPIRPPLDAAATAALAADGLLRWHFRAAEGVLIETAAFDRPDSAGHPGTAPGDRLAMHVAWLSGVPTAAALLAFGRRAGRADAVAAARRVLDKIASHLAPCGTFWDQWTAEDGWGKGWTPGPDAVHSRTIAEATLFMARAGEADARSTWRAAVASNAAFVVGVQRADGLIPSAWNGRTGAPLSWAGTPGLAWVPALVAAAALVGEPSWLDAARRAGTGYADAVESGSLGGAPEDVDLGPTSEDGYVALMAYAALVRSAGNHTERSRWLALARRSADWMLTFRFAWDVPFRARSVLGQAGFRTRGADVASPANQHLHAYGLICSADLLDLTEWTSDPTYRDRARETFACFRQSIARRDGDLGARRGMTPERYYQTRYDGEQGTVGRLSHAWCLGLLLDAAELALQRPELADA